MSPVETLKQVERRHILETIRRFEGHRERTAKALGIGVRTLTMKLRSYGIEPRTKFTFENVEETPT